MTDAPTGPYAVATADARLPDPETGLRLRLFYPTPRNPTTPTAPWFPRSTSKPDETTLAVLQYAGFPASRLLARVLSPVANAPMPASRSPSLDTPDAVLPGDTPRSPPGALPVALLSHGLGGGVANYSSMCIELASHGLLVLAPEHTDGSAFLARLGAARVELPYRPYRRATHGENETPFRTRQTNVRMRDVDDVLRVLTAVHDGDASFATVPGAAELPDLRGRVDLNRLVLVGHSFGSTTVMSYVASRPGRVAKVVCLDAWLAPLAEEVSRWDVGDTDVLFVDQGDSRMSLSIAARQKLARPSGVGTVDAVKVLGGLHNNASDFPLRVPKLLAVATGMTAFGSDPLALLQAQNGAAVEFLRGRGAWQTFREGVKGGKANGLALAELGEARVLYKGK